MTKDEALAKWKFARQCSHWKGNFTPEENDSDVPNLERKLRIAVAVEEVKPEGFWPSANYTAMVKVVTTAGKPEGTIGQGAAAVKTAAVPEQCFYLAVR